MLRCPGFRFLRSPARLRTAALAVTAAAAIVLAAAAGQVRDVEVVKSTSRLLNRGSVEAVRRFACRPPGRDVLVTVEIAYQLE